MVEGSMKKWKRAWAREVKHNKWDAKSRHVEWAKPKIHTRKTENFDEHDVRTWKRNLFKTNRSGISLQNTHERALYEAQKRPMFYFGVTYHEIVEKKNSVHTTQVSAFYTVTHKQAERWTWKMRIINRFSPQEVEPREYDETSEGKELGPSSFMGTQRWKVRWKWRHVRINQKGKGDMKSDSKALRR